MNRTALLLTLALSPVLARAQATTRSATTQPTTAPAIIPFAPLNFDLHRVHAAQTTFIWENDGAQTNFVSPSDRWYTSGAYIGLQWQGEDVDDVVQQLPSIGGEFDRWRPLTSYAAGVVGGFEMYTPQDLSRPDPIEDDRPYAGLAYMGLIAQRANRLNDVAVFEHWELDFGVIGRASQAGKIQNWLHEHIDTKDIPHGWRNQVEDDFGVDIKYLRRWRYDVADIAPIGDARFQVIPEVGARLGTFHTDAFAGCIFRLGWNLPDDSGPTSGRYLGDFTAPFRETGPYSDLAEALKPSGIYFFFEPRAHAIAHDSTIQGSLFQDSPVTQTLEPFVGEFICGFAIQFFRHWEFAYVETFTTPEFADQEKVHDFASLIFRGTFTW